VKALLAIRDVVIPALEMFKGRISKLQIPPRDRSVVHSFAGSKKAYTRRPGTAAAPCRCRGSLDGGPREQAQAAVPAPKTTRLSGGIGRWARAAHGPPVAAAALESGAGQPAVVATEATNQINLHKKKFGYRYF
jgi:hypothetical protein